MLFRAISRIALLVALGACSSTTHVVGNSGGAAGASGANGAAGAAGEGSTEVPVKDGLVLWLDATTGVASDASKLVEKWADRSGHAMDAAQVASGTRPMLVDASGLPAISFDGIDDRLTLPAGFDDFSSGLSLFMVARPAEYACMQPLQLSNGPELDDIAINATAPLGVEYEVLDSVTATGDGALVQNQTSVITAIHTPPEHVELRLQGVMATTSDTALLPKKIARTVNYVGDGVYTNCGYWSGLLFEILLYQRPLSASEVASVEGYLQKKWACCKL